MRRSSKKSRKVSGRRRLATAVASLVLFVLVDIVGGAVATLFGVSNAAARLGVVGVIALSTLIVFGTRRLRDHS
jgi:hypothetical protein